MSEAKRLAGEKAIEFVEDGMIVAGTFDNVKGVVRNDGNRRTAELTSLGWNNEFQLDDNWAATFDVSFSKADRTDTVLETNAGTGRNIDGALRVGLILAEAAKPSPP